MKVTDKPVRSDILTTAGLLVFLRQASSFTTGLGDIPLQQRCLDQNNIEISA